MPEFVPYKDRNMNTPTNTDINSTDDLKQALSECEALTDKLVDLAEICFHGQIVGRDMFADWAHCQVAVLERFDIVYLDARLVNAAKGGAWMRWRTRQAE